MITSESRRIIWLTLPLTVLVALVSIVGLVTPGFYALETPNWRAQCIGQDMADLFLVTPILLITVWLTWKRSIAGQLILVGTVLYLLYTFTIYCFAVHFIMLFPVYCIILGLCFYTMISFFHQWIRHPSGLKDVPGKLTRITAIYFMIISVLFYILWLAEILPSILNGTVPPSLSAVDLPTNPVHAIDLSIFLPGLFITGILLLKKKPIATVLAIVLLTFMVLMDITIGGLMLVIKYHGLEANLGIAAAMAVLALFSLTLLVLHLRRAGPGAPKTV